MNHRNLPWMMIAGMLGAAVLAGCTTPDESVNVGDDQRIMIDDNVYECDDTIQTDDACQEWLLVDDAETQPDTTYTSEADGSVTIEGQRFVCDDVQNVDLDAGQDAQTQAGACEEYIAQSEA